MSAAGMLRRQHPSPLDVSEQPITSLHESSLRRTPSRPSVRRRQHRPTVGSTARRSLRVSHTNLLTERLRSNKLKVRAATGTIPPRSCWRVLAQVLARVHALSLHRLVDPHEHRLQKRLALLFLVCRLADVSPV